MDSGPADGKIFAIEESRGCPVKGTNWRQVGVH